MNKLIRAYELRQGDVIARQGKEYIVTSNKNGKIRFITEQSGSGNVISSASKEMFELTGKRLINKPWGNTQVKKRKRV